jgi:acetyl-CoA synthetase
MAGNNKTVLSRKIQPNLINYDEIYAEFDWEDVKEELAGLPGDKGLNIAYEAIDKHVDNGAGDHLAIRWINKKGQIKDFSYGYIKEETNRFANVLKNLGVKKGDKVFSLAGRIPELYFAALGTLKNVSVFCPLFSAFGPEPIHQRLSRGDGKVLVTTTRLYQKKIKSLLERLPKLKFVLITDSENDLSDRVLSLTKLMKKASPHFNIPPTDPEDMALLHFTSGTTGMPKGAIHVHNAVYTHYITGKYVLDFHPDDIFWCTADPGWVTGTSYGIISPFVHGITNIIDEADFDAERWYSILQDQKVSVWYTAPTAIRMLMRLNINPLEKYDLEHLRLIHSVGEPLNPEAVEWGRETLGMPILDNWWQTETGGIMIANYPSMEIKDGSMGKPLPGIQAGIVKRISEHKVEEIKEKDTVGELALKPAWPSMFRGYLHDKKRYNKCFIGEWYITGDLAKIDSDGYYWFVGRADDIIKTSGHMVGPFEVESALMEHPAVAEVGVIGKPDPVIGELVKAFIALKPGNEASDSLRLDIIGFARTKLGSAVAPKEVEFVKNLPKTRSGKIMRRLLKSRELGLPEGDTSTLETKL